MGNGSYLFHGPSGAGKTTLAASAARDVRSSPCLLLNVENRLKYIDSIRRDITFADLGKLEKGKVDCLRIYEWEDMIRIYDWDYDNKNKDKLHTYKTLITDSTTEAHDLTLS